MKCSRLLGHRWSRWRKKLGAVKKDAAERLVCPILLVRRCALCGYLEEVWLNSVAIIKEAPEKKEGKLKD